jgi:type IV pilus assembly protein PilB
MNLLDYLLSKGIIDDKKFVILSEKIKKSQKRIEEVILQEKILSEEQLFRAKAELFKIPFWRVDAEKILPDVLKIIPEETARMYKILALAKEGDVLRIGMVYPEDLKAQEVLNFLSALGNFSYQVVLITNSDFELGLSKYKVAKVEVEKALLELKEKLGEELKLEEIEKEEEIKVEEAPVSKIVSVILKYGLEGEASDIHIEPFGNKLRVRFRRLGELSTSFLLPIKLLPAIVSRIKIISNLKIDETRIPQDGRFSLKFQNKEIDFRVSTFPTGRGEKVAIRILDPTVGLREFEELGFSSFNFEIVKRNIKKPYGMILVTGPTGSGKTTTLYSILKILNRESVNIITLEDPIEYFIEGVNQSQIRPEIGYTFAKGLRHILRQNPDIIMVGEIRDKETADLAIHAALTGHLLLSTLHTNNALGAIPRLLDLGIPFFLISATLNIVIAQRLVRKLCGHCKKKVILKGEMKNLVEKTLNNLPSILKQKYIKNIQTDFVFEPVGCEKCNKTGFIDRIALFEVLEMTPKLSELSSFSEENIFKIAREEGMITMFEDGILKVLDGTTTLEEVFRATTINQ